MLLIPVQNVIATTNNTLTAFDVLRKLMTRTYRLVILYSNFVKILDQMYYIYFENIRYIQCKFGIMLN